MSLFETHVIDSGKPGPNLLLIATVHGDEYEGVEALRSILSDRRPELICGRLTVIPVVNVSAFEAGTRTGSDGLDLARTLPGRPDGTITERVAHELAILIRQSDFLIDLHSGGKVYRMEPLVGYMMVSNHDVLERQREMARAFGLPTIWGTSAELDGRTLSAARDANVPAIYSEYLGAGECSQEGVEAYVSGCLNVMRRYSMLDGLPQPDRFERRIEDRRSGAGHLQIQNPSPKKGTFETTLELGQSVQTGESIGWIAGQEGRTEVFADRSGRVIGLRAVSDVAKGDSLLVVLEATTDPN